MWPFSNVAFFGQCGLFQCGLFPMWLFCSTCACAPVRAHPCVRTRACATASERPSK
jgi:hypothetical protein